MTWIQIFFWWVSINHLATSAGAPAEKLPAEKLPVAEGVEVPKTKPTLGDPSCHRGLLVVFPHFYHSVKPLKFNSKRPLKIGLNTPKGKERIVFQASFFKAGLCWNFGGVLCCHPSCQKRPPRPPLPAPPKERLVSSPRSPHRWALSLYQVAEWYHINKKSKVEIIFIRTFLQLSNRFWLKGIWFTYLFNCSLTRNLRKTSPFGPTGTTSQCWLLKCCKFWLYLQTSIYAMS